MFFVADLHLHSKYSRATSKEMTLENLWKWAQYKGIRVISATDFTHPLWFAELEQKLEPAESGLFKLKDNIEKNLLPDVPEICRADTRFILSTEISSIYSKNGRVRKIHNIIFAPSFEIARKINQRLAAIGNLRADGRPILGLDAKILLKIVLDISRDCMLVPAHAWTPHFSVFGSNSGFDSLEECFEELAPNIFAIETGLSSDPAMNWRLSSLDNITLISNSDSHSLPKIGRECNAFDTDFSYQGISDAMKKENADAGKKLVMTVEFFPEEGKYHFDGHRNCNKRLHPKESQKHKNLCPACSKPLTIGVLNRVEQLADREEGYHLRGAAPFKKLIPLNEIIAEALGTTTSSIKVHQEYQKLISLLGSELKILMKTPIEEIKKVSLPIVAEAVKRVREENLHIEAGYDGEYGIIHIFSDEERAGTNRTQSALF